MGTIRRISIVINATDRASGTLDDVNRKADQTADSFSEADQKAEALRTTFFALAGATAAVGGSMAAMTMLGSEIDETLAIVQATAGATAQSMDLVRSKIQRVGAEMPVLMIDVAEAFRELSYAGFSAAESIAAVDAVTDIAISGQMAIADASRIVSTSLRAFNMQAKQSGAVASAFGAIFADSATTIQELGQAMEYLGPIASTAGQSIVEVSAALGVLADNGLRASRAGTGLQQFFSRIVSPIGRAEDAMAELGITTEDFLDEEGNFKDMYEMVNQISAAFEGLSEAERLQAMIDIFGERGARALAPLIDNPDELVRKIGEAASADLKTAIEEFQDLSEEEFEEIESIVSFDIRPDMSRDQILQSIVDASEEIPDDQLTNEMMVGLGVDERTAQILLEDINDGASVQELSDALENATSEADIAAAIMDTVGGKIEYITGSVESIAYVMYTGFRPALKFVLDLMIAFVDVLTANEWATKAFGAALVGVVGALALLTASTGLALLQSIAGGGILATLALGLKSTAVGAAMLGGASKVAAGFVWLMTANMATLRATAFGVIPALKGSAGALALVKGGLVKATAALWGFFAALGPIGWLVILISGLILAYTTNLFGFRDAVDAVLSPVRWLAGALQWMGESIIWVGEAILWLANWTGKAILDALLWPFRMVIGAIQSLVGWYDELGTLGKLIVLVLFPVLGMAWAIMETFELLGQTWQDLKDLFGDIPQGIRDAWAALGQSIGDGFRAAAPYVRALISPIVAVHRAFKSIGDYVQWLGDLIHNTFADMEAAMSRIPLIGRLFSDSVEKKGGGQSLLGSVATGVQQEESVLVGAVKGAADYAASYLPSSDAERGPFSDLTQRGRSLIESLSGGAQQSESGLAGTLEGIARTAMSHLPDGRSAVGGASGLLQSALGPFVGLPQSGAMGAGIGQGTGATGGVSPISVTVTVNNDFGDTSEPQEVAQATGNSVRNVTGRVITELEDAFMMSRSAPAGGGG